MREGGRGATLHKTFAHVAVYWLSFIKSCFWCNINIKRCCGIVFRRLGMFSSGERSCPAAGAAGTAVGAAVVVLAASWRWSHSSPLLSVGGCVRVVWLWGASEGVVCVESAPWECC